MIAYQIAFDHVASRGMISKFVRLLRVVHVYANRLAIFAPQTPSFRRKEGMGIYDADNIENMNLY